MVALGLCWVGADAVAVKRQQRRTEVLATAEEKERPISKVITMLKDSNAVKIDFLILCLWGWDRKS